MVGSFGMAGSLVSLRRDRRGPIGSKNLVGKVLADSQGKARVEEILTEQKERVTKLLEENRDVVVGLRTRRSRATSSSATRSCSRIELVLDSRNPAAR